MWSSPSKLLGEEKAQVFQMCELLSLKHPEQGAILSTQHNGILADGECTPGAHPRSRSLCCVRLRYNADEVHRCSSGDAAREVREGETPCQRSHYCAAGLNEHLSTVRNGGQRPSPSTVGGVDGGVYCGDITSVRKRTFIFTLLHECHFTPRGLSHYLKDGIP